VGTDLHKRDRGLTEGVGKLDILFDGGHCGRGLEAAHVLAEVGESGAGGLSALQVLAGEGTCRKGKNPRKQRTLKNE
jgi:predicted ABC-type transport system involved in lysophospholipase L1 biosynthesis ATPase subunit